MPAWVVAVLAFVAEAVTAAFVEATAVFAVAIAAWAWFSVVVACWARDDTLVSEIAALLAEASACTAAAWAWEFAAVTVAT
jgi:hypothetical protein